MIAGRVLETKLVNALIPDAEADETIDLPYIDQTTWNILRWFKSRHRGLWVGGEAKITDTHFVFEPNDANRFVHRNDTSFAFPLRAIMEASVEPGLLTKIIAIRTAERTYRIRCFGAAAFVESIRRRVRMAAG